MVTRRENHLIRRCDATLLETVDVVLAQLHLRRERVAGSGEGGEGVGRHLCCVCAGIWFFALHRSFPFLAVRWSSHVAAVGMLCWDYGVLYLRLKISLYRRLQTTAKRSAWVRFTVIVEPPGGRRTRTPGMNA